MAKNQYSTELEDIRSFSCHMHLIYGYFFNMQNEIWPELIDCTDYDQLYRYEQEVQNLFKFYYDSGIQHAQMMTQSLRDYKERENSKINYITLKKIKKSSISLYKEGEKLTSKVKEVLSEQDVKLWYFKNVISRYEQLLENTAFIIKEIENIEKCNPALVKNTRTDRITKELDRNSEKKNSYIVAQSSKENNHILKKVNLLIGGGIIASFVSFLLPKYFNENKPPKAIITLNKKAGIIPTTILFDATKSSDPEGGDLYYEWMVNNKLTSKKTSFKETFNKKGIYHIILKVSDTGNKSGKTSAIVEILGNEYSMKPIEPNGQKAVLIRTKTDNSTTSKNISIQEQRTNSKSLSKNKKYCVAVLLSKNKSLNIAKIYNSARRNNTFRDYKFQQGEEFMIDRKTVNSEANWYKVIPTDRQSFKEGWITDLYIKNLKNCKL